MTQPSNTGQDTRWTLALSRGPSGGFYLHPRRLCLGRLALTFVPDVEVDDLMETYVAAGEGPRGCTCAATHVLVGLYAAIRNAEPVLAAHTPNSTAHDDLLDAMEEASEYLAAVGHQNPST